MSTEDENVRDDTDESVIDYNFRGLGLGEVGSIKQWIDILGKGVHEISERRQLWSQLNLDSVYSNMSVTTAYFYESMLNDIKEGPGKDKDLPSRGSSEVILATIILNTLDLGEQLGMDLPGTIAEAYNFRVNAIKKELEELKKEASKQKTVN